MRSDSDNMPILVGALRSTLERLQEQEELRPDDPVLRDIKSSILLTIARRERESEETREESAA